MLERLFVFGLPGSGKSTISQHIVDHVEREAQTKDWSALPINDYHILYEMFLTEKKRERFKNFRPVKHEGFYVFNPVIYEIALKELSKQLQNLHDQHKAENKLIIVEFARNNYFEALKTFDNLLLQRSYIILLVANIETCKQRVNERVLNRVSIDDHFVSDDTFKAYQGKDSRDYAESVLSYLQTNYGISDGSVIDTGGERMKQEVMAEVDNFVDRIMGLEGSKPDMLKDTEKFMFV